jgi:catechol 2,3-dioxygenase-like lactoylglutathione lyase family enzyme
MKLRVARHTTNIDTITTFYTQLLGLKVLGDFKNHDGYDGIFLGLADADWHLEFTISAEAPIHQPDEDDLLVFYPNTTEKYQELVNSFEKAKISPINAKNPYWETYGVTYADPDGYRVVVAKVVEVI